MTEAIVQALFAIRDGLLALQTAELEELTAYQQRELDKLLSHFRSASAEWNLRLNGVRTLADLPITERAILRNHALRTPLPNTTVDDYVVHKTSGSTNEPVQILKHKLTYGLDYEALVLVEWLWHERDITKRMGWLRVGAQDSDSWPVGAPLSHLGAVAPAFSREVTHRHPGELLDAVIKNNGAYLYLNSLSSRAVALEQLRRLASGGPEVRVEQILGSTDRVDQSVRDLVGRAFGARMVDRYSCEEVGFIALECGAEEHLHVVPNVVVEIVRPDGSACEIGEPGRVLLTALHSVAQPILRYDVGDIAQWGEPCATCSWPVIAEIHGRTRQLVRQADGSDHLVTLVGADLLKIEQLVDFILVRYDDAVVILANLSEPLSDSVHQRVCESLQKVFRTSDLVQLIPASNLPASRKRQEFYLAAGPAPASAEEVLSDIALA